MKKILAFAFIGFVISSCKKDVASVNHGDFPKDVGRIMANSCALSGCHDSKSYQAAAGLDLSSWRSLFKGSNSGSPVIPFSPKFSSLCYFINTYEDLGIQNVPTMPLNRSSLSREEVKLVQDWIQEGAKDVNGNVMWGDDPARKKLYAVNQGCDVVTVFDANTQLPIRYIDVGNKPGVIESPHQIRVSPDGQNWYVNFINNNILQKYRCSDDHLVAEIPMVPNGSTYYGDWNTFLITKDSKKAFCVSWKTLGKLVCLDLVNHKFVKELNIPDNPHAIALSADEKKVYVGTQMGNYINEIDTEFTFINPISIDGQAPSGTSSLDIHDMVLDELNNRLVMTCQKTNQVKVYHIASNTVIATVSVGLWPQEIVYTSKTDQYFVTCMNDHTVSRIDNNSWLTSSLPVGFLPHGICVDERKKLIYVLSRNVQPNGPAPHHTSVCAGRNGFVNFIDLNTFTLLKKKYEMSVDPYFISPIP